MTECLYTYRTRLRRFSEDMESDDFVLTDIIYKPPKHTELWEWRTQSCQPCLRTFTVAQW